jgi:hypothetical protein
VLVEHLTVTVEDPFDHVRLAAHPVVGPGPVAEDHPEGVDVGRAEPDRARVRTEALEVALEPVGLRDLRDALDADVARQLDEVDVARALHRLREPDGARVAPPVVLRLVRFVLRPAAGDRFAGRSFVDERVVLADLDVRRQVQGVVALLHDRVLGRDAVEAVGERGGGHERLERRSGLTTRPAAPGDGRVGGGQLARSSLSGSH